MTVQEENELRQVLAIHALRYPAMRPTDAVKLIFQNEFGGGHLISDPTRSLEMLRNEYEKTPRDGGLSLTEEIGNGMTRVMLNALDASRYSLEQLNNDFVRSAELHTGSRSAFLEKIDLLRAATKDGVFGFSSAELEAYLERYLANGCPAVSHSPEYRAAYSPAYRILYRRASLLFLLLELRSRSKSAEPVLVAIDGRCASGKSTFAERLKARFGWSVIRMDDFFLRPNQRTPERYDTPGENIDHERFLTEVLAPLRDRRLTEYQRFDCHTMRLTEPIPFKASPVVLIEGSYACHPELWDYYDLHVFLTVDPEEQMRRIVLRNGKESAGMFRDKWIPLEERYFSAFSLERVCEYDLTWADSAKYGNSRTEL